MGAHGTYPRQLYDPCCTIGGIPYRECSYIWRDAPHDANYMMVAMGAETPETSPRGLAKFSASTGQLLRAVLIDWDGLKNYPLVDYVGPCVRSPKSDKVYVAYSLLTAANVTANTTWFAELDADTLAFSKKSQTPGAVGFAGGGLCFPGVNVSPPGTVQECFEIFANATGTFVGARFREGVLAFWDVQANTVLYTDYPTLGYNFSCLAPIESPDAWCFDKSGDLYTYVQVQGGVGRLDKYHIAAGPTLTLIASYPIGDGGEGLGYIPSTDEFLTSYQKNNGGGLEVYFRKISNVSKTIVDTVKIGFTQFTWNGDSTIGGALSASIPGSPMMDNGNWIYDTKIIGVKRRPHPFEAFVLGFQVLDLRTFALTFYDLSLWPDDPANDRPFDGLYFSSLSYVTNVNTIWTQHFNGFAQTGPNFTYQGFGIYGFPGPKAADVLVPLPHPAYVLGPKGSMV